MASHRTIAIPYCALKTLNRLDIIRMLTARFYHSIIFQQCINFLVDTYTLYAASAVAANTFLRSLLASGFPLVARPMFYNLGVGPAMSILGAIACLALPVPLLFMKYGLRLRKMSKFAPVEDD